MSDFLNTCLSFDGKDDYVDCGNGPEISDALTIEAWVKSKKEAGYEYGQIIYCGVGNSDNGYGLLLSKNDILQVEFHNTTANSKMSLETPYPNDGKWHHVAIAWDKAGQTCTVYLDGLAQQKTDKFAHTILLPVEGHGLSIGRNAKRQNQLKGSVAEVRIWNIKRTTAEIQANLHRSLTHAQENLVGCWPLNGNTNDISGQNHHAINNGATWTQDDQLEAFRDDQPTTLLLNGDGDYIDGGTGPSVSEALTVEAWIKAEGNSGCIIDRGEGANKAGYALLLSGGKLRVEMSDNTPASKVTIDNPFPADKKWHHVAFAWSKASGPITAYIDGVAQENTHDFASSLHLAAQKLSIGASVKPDNYFRGQIAEVRIWNEARTADMIKAKMKNRLTGHEDGLVAYWPLQADGILADEKTGGFEHALLKGSAGYALSTDRVFDKPKVDNAVLSFNSTGNRVIDMTDGRSHGYNNGGNWTIDPELKVPGAKERYCLDLSGVNTYVNCGPGPDLSDALTVEAWIKAESASGCIVNRGGGWGTDGYSMLLVENKVRIELQNGISDQSVHIDNPFPTDQKWHHVAFTWAKTSGKLTIYMDGTAQANTGNFTSSIALPTQPLTFGRNPKHGLYYNGKMAEVRIWNKERTASDISADKEKRLSGNEEGLVGYWPMDGVREYVDARLEEHDQWSGSFTVSFWAKATIEDGQPLLEGAGLFSNQNHGETDGSFQIDIDGSGNYRFNHKNGSHILGPVKPDTWQFISVSYNQETKTLLSSLEDEEKSETNFDLTRTRFTDYVIGRNRSGDRPFSGSIANLTIWNFAKTAVQVKSSWDYRLSGGEAGLVGYFPLDDGFGNKAPNLAAPPVTLPVGEPDTAPRPTTIELSIVGATWESDPNIKLSKAEFKSGSSDAIPYGPVRNPVIALNGNHDYLDCGKVDFAKGSYTIEAWFNTKGRGIDIFAATHEANHGILLEVSNDGTLRFLHRRVYDIQGGTNTLSESVVVNDGNWHHCAAVMGAAPTGAANPPETKHLYIDGVLVASSAGQEAFPDILDVVIGRISPNNAARSFKGNLAEVRVWKTARTLDQIKNNKDKRLTGNESGLVAYWPMDSTDAAAEKAEDKAGSHDATLHGAKWQRDDTFVFSSTLASHPTLSRDTVLAFNGKPDYVDCGQIPFKSGSYTIEAWFNSTSTGDILTGSMKDSQNRDAHGILIEITNEGTLRYLHRNPPGTTGGTDTFSTGVVVNDGKWRHCSAVMTTNPDTTIKTKHLYIDGLLVKSSNQPTAFQNDLHVVLGRMLPDNNSRSYKGKLAEVRIWNTARSAAEIKDHKDHRLVGNEPGLVAYWPLDSADMEVKTAEDKARSKTSPVHGPKWESDPTLQLLAPGAAPVSSPSGTPAGQPGAPAGQPGTPTTQPGTPTGQPGTTGVPTPTTPLTVPYPVSPLTGLTTEQENNLPDWIKTVKTEAAGATSGTTLTVKKDTFSGFGILSYVPDALFSLITIENFKIELANGAEGAEADADPTSNQPATVGSGKTERPKPVGKRFRIKKTGGVRISGTTSLLGLVAADISLEFTMDDRNNKDCVVKVKASEDNAKNISKVMGDTSALTDILEVLGECQLVNPAFAFSTSSVFDTDEPFDVGIGEGFNFYGRLDISEFKDDDPRILAKMMAFMASTFKVEAITVRLCLKKLAAGFDISLDAIIETDIVFFDGKDFKFAYKGAVVSLALGGSPPEPSISVSSTLQLTLSYIGADELLMTGTIALEPESISFAFTLDTAEDKPWHPFNLDGLSVKAAALQIGATYTPPWIDNIGVAIQELQIGNVTGSMAIIIDSNDYDNFVFQMAVVKITAIEMVTVFCPPAFLAYQALPAVVTDPLEKVVNVQVSDAELAVVPVATSIGELVFEDEGITAKGDISLWGWEASMYARLSTNEIDLRANMDPIKLSLAGMDLFKVEGALPGEDPSFKLYLGTARAPEFYMSIAVTILSVRNTVLAKADKQGMVFILENRTSFSRFRLEALANSTKFYAKGSIDLTLNLTVPIPAMGDIKLVDVNFGASAMMQIDHNFYLRLAGSIPFMNQNREIVFELREAIPDFETLLKKLLEYLKSKAKEIFGAVFKTLGEWARAVADGLIAFGGNVADVAKDVFKLGENAVGEIIKASEMVGDGVVKMAEGMKKAYGWTADQMAGALKGAGYAADKVAEGLKNAYDLGAQGVAQALKGAGYAANEIAGAVGDVFDITKEGLALALKGAGYAADQVAQGVEAAYNLGADGVAAAMKGAGYAADEVVDALDYGLGVAESGIDAALKGAGFATDLITSALKPIQPINWLPSPAKSLVKSISSWF